MTAATLLVIVLNMKQSKIPLIAIIFLYLTGTIGYEDVDCDYIGGYTYVRAQSPGLDRTLRQELAAFSNDLRRNSGTDRGTGQVSLEFYQRKKRWLVQAEDIPWEVWTVRCELVHLGNEQERLRLQEKVGEMLSEKVIALAFHVIMIIRLLTK